MIGQSRGFTIIETLVAIAIGAIAIAGVVSMIEQVGQSQSTQKYGYEANNLTEEMRTALGSNAACFNTFKNIHPNAIINKTVDFPGPIFNDANNAVYQVGQVYGDRAVKLQSLELSNYGTSNSFGGVLSLLVDFTATASVNGGKFLRRTINLQVTTDASGNLTACISQGKATDGLWKITPSTNTDIYYAGGNVGVGVTAAKFPFQVAAGNGQPAMQMANFSANANYMSVGLNNTSLTPSRRSALVYEKSGTALFETGIDVGQTGAQNYYLYDNAALAIRMLVDGVGNVGIGTTAPVSMLQVNGVVTAPQLQSPTTSAPLILRTQADQFGPGSVYSYSPAGPMFEIGPGATAPNAWIRSGAGNASTASHFQVVSFNGGNSSLALNPGGGYVGVGTSNPVSTLQIVSPSEGNIYMGAGRDFAFDGGNDQYFTFVNTQGAGGKTSFNGNGNQFLMMLNSNGNVGIGSSNPLQRLDVAGDIGVNGVDVIRRDGTNAYLFPWSSGYGNNNIQVGGGPGTVTNLNIPTGNLGIGTANARVGLEVYSNSITFHHGTSNNPVGYFVYGALPTQSTPTVDVQYNGGSDSEFFFAHNGKKSGSTNWVWQRPGTGIVDSLMILDNTGNFTITGCATYSGGQAGNCASDARLKKDVIPFTSGLDKVLGLNPVWFKYNGLGNIAADENPRLGVIAQDLEKVAPELVGHRLAKLNKTDAEETEFRTVNYTSFIYLVINAIKEFYALWKTDHAALAQLQAENAALKAQVEAQARDLSLIKQKLGLPK